MQLGQRESEESPLDESPHSARRALIDRALLAQRTRAAPDFALRETDEEIETRALS